MAPDYTRPAPVVRATNLYLKLYYDLVDAGYMTADQLHQQLLYAFYTLPPQNKVDWRVEQVMDAFTWANTCQGEEFWDAIYQVQIGDELSAIGILEHLLEDE